MVEKAGFDVKNVTTHSGRKRMIQKLNGPSRSIPPTHICKSSGHKNVQSLNSILSERRQKKKVPTFWVDTRSAGAIIISSRYFQCFDSEYIYTVQSSTTQQPFLYLKGKSHFVLAFSKVQKTRHFVIMIRIRNFLFQDTVSVHTHNANTAANPDIF